MIVAVASDHWWYCCVLCHQTRCVANAIPEKFWEGFWLVGLSVWNAEISAIFWNSETSVIFWNSDICTWLSEMLRLSYLVGGDAEIQDASGFFCWATARVAWVAGPPLSTWFFDVKSKLWPDVERVFRTLIKKLISELTWKPRDESFEAFDRVISTCGLL